VIKVRHSKSKRVLLLDFSGGVGKQDLIQAGKDISIALSDIGRGYTLIEIFHDQPRFERGAGLEAGTMVGSCYENNRIWRVIRIEDKEHADPGLSILHQTRWKREIPVLTMDNIKEAVAVAKEEALEQSDWWVD